MTRGGRTLARCAIPAGARSDLGLNLFCRAAAEKAELHAGAILLDLSPAAVAGVSGRRERQLPSKVFDDRTMGSSQSKSEGGPQQHVFAADHPVRFSENLVNSLQSSPELLTMRTELQTDSTRAQNLELIIQQRVTSELEKHLAAASDKLSQLSESISKEPFDPKQKSASDSSSSDKPLITRITERLSGKGDSDSDQQPAFDPNIDRNAVAKEIEDLRKKLDSRKKKVDMDKDVEKAKEELVICLRKNDRRPLDCWREVEHFKTEVGRLEKSFVDRNT